MTALKTRPDNLDFIFEVSNLDQYFIPSLVLVQSILENNLWANQIQISIFYENLSPEQKKAYKKLIDNFNKSQSRDFVILNLFDVSKLEFEIQANYHGFNMNFRMEGIKYIKPISNWIFSMDVNELNIRSLEPLISKLNQDFLNYWAVTIGNGLRIINCLDGSFIKSFPGPLFIFNSQYLFIKNGILERVIRTYRKILNIYPNLKDTVFLKPEFFLRIALKNIPVGLLNIVFVYSKQLDKIPNSFYFVKFNSNVLSPWFKESPDIPLKHLWLDYASKNPMSKNFQISYSFKKKLYLLRIEFLIFLHCRIYFPLLHSIGRISPKLFHKFFALYINIIPKI